MSKQSAQIKIRRERTEKIAQMTKEELTRYAIENEPRAVKNMRKILADKNVKSVEQKNGWTYVHLNNGQIFGCRGPVVDAALTGDAPAEKPVKDYWRPKKGEGIGTITCTVNGTPSKRKRVFIEAEFEHFGEKFFVYKHRSGGRAATHAETGGAVGDMATEKVGDTVKRARAILDKYGEEKAREVFDKARAAWTPEFLAALPLDENMGG